MKPILFNTEMVRAILKGRKTVTRRIIKPQPDIDGLVRFDAVSFVDTDARLYKPPYQPGDILYVRETWSKDTNGEYVYRANYGTTEDDSFPPSMFKWRPSIHMPKEAARLFLLVTSVRAERLQECGNGWCLGIEKEGIVTPKDPILYLDDDEFHTALREEFQKLWDSTIKPADREKYGWEANPWVWEIEFERISKEKV